MSILRDLRFLCRVSSDLFLGAFRLRHMKNAVTIFGSARLDPAHPYCLDAHALAFGLAKSNLAVATGGGSAIMHAANEGAKQGGGVSVGINIWIPREQRLNPHTTLSRTSRYFFIRKLLLSRKSIAFVAYPGGFGTMDELFEIITLIQTGKMNDCPVLLVNEAFWGGMIAWCRETLLPHGMITEKELARLKIVENSTEALVILQNLALK